MDTRHMRYFVALAETLHFGRAAARMNMSQPPFSRQIAAIETALGVKLFERNSRNVSLTHAGKHFLEDCRRILADFDTACRDARLTASGVKGELRLGFTMYAANGLIPALVRRHSEARPDVRLILEERLPSDIDAMLMDGTLDIAVTFRGAYAPHLRTHLLARDRLCLIAPAGHPLTTQGSISPADLAGEKLIAAPSSVVPVLRAAIDAYCASGGVLPHFAFEPRLQHTIIRLVEEELGLALIPQSLSTGLGDRIVARELEGAPEFDVVLSAAFASKNPAIAPFFELAETATLTEPSRR